MASTLKSIRIDNDVLALMEEYREFQQNLFGNKLSLANIINMAIPEYITTQTFICMLIEPDQPIVSINEQGKMQHVSVSKDIYEHMKRINETAAEMSNYYENGIIHHPRMSDDEILSLAEYIKSKKK